MKVHLITSCSSSRMIAPKVLVSAIPRPTTTQRALDWWLAELEKYEPEVTAREQYRGLGFSTLVKIQEMCDLTSVKVITGGLGLTDLDEKIVPYDFSASPKEEHYIQQAVTMEPFVQTVWWSMINQARHSTRTPVADLVKADPENFVLVSANKVFLRYAAEDILSLSFEERKRVRILLAASSLGSVPMQLRPMIIPFAREAINHIPGNRNDGTHRAAFVFLEKVKQGMDLMAPVEQQTIEAFRTEAGLSGAGVAATVMTKFALQKILEEHPEYLKMTSEEAYKVIRREHGAIGGRMFFRGIFRACGGEVIDIKVSDTERERADDAFEGLEFLQASNGSEEDQALKGLTIFVDGLKKKAPNAQFTAANVVAWATRYYNDEDKAPESMQSPNKLAHMLKSNAELLGLREVDASGGKAYALRGA